MQVRVSQSVENFKARVLSTWGLPDWEGVDSTEDLLFFGLYNDRDYEVFNNYKGKKTVFWCGSDVLFVMKDYERRRILKNNPAEHFCENEVEQKNLELCGVKAKIVPSFLDKIENFPGSYEYNRHPHVFMCGHPNREGEYGFDYIRSIARRVPDITFHLYGIDKSDNFFYQKKAKITQDMATVDEEVTNIWHHGKVPEGQFNNEIVNYQCGLRTNAHDGFSEVTAKSVLMGQYPITRIKYPHIWNYETDDELVALLEKLKHMKHPNTEGRSYYLKNLNRFPWVKDNYFYDKS